MADRTTRVGAETGARQRHLHRGLGNSLLDLYGGSRDRHVDQCLLFIFEVLWSM